MLLRHTKFLTLICIIFSKGDLLHARDVADALDRYVGHKIDLCIRRQNQLNGEHFDFCNKNLKITKSNDVISLEVTWKDGRRAAQEYRLLSQSRVAKSIGIFLNKHGKITRNDSGNSATTIFSMEAKRDNIFSEKFKIYFISNGLKAVLISEKRPEVAFTLLQGEFEFAYLE